jgi:hypothetical protein
MKPNNMKKFIFLTLSIALTLFSCEKNEEGNPKPKQLNATDGFAVGCIHIDFEKDPEVTNVFLERREKGTEQWQMITSTQLTSFDENSGYPNTGMPPGKVFEYRVKNGSPEDAEYSEIEEGYAYDIIPVTEIEITSNVNWDDRTMNTLSWNESNNGTFINESEIYFDIYRSEDSLGVYDKVGQVGEDRSYVDELPANMLGTKVYYRIDVYYSFELNLPSGGMHWETTTPVQGTVHGALPDQGGNPTIDYTSADLGQIAQASADGIPQILEKNIDGTMYLGLINNAGATGIGIPELYRLDGASWQKQWTSNPLNEFDEINYAIASGSQYVAGVQDSLCVYAWNGSSWSDNLAADNLGQADSPSQLSIEVDNEDLYMAIKQYPDYELQVLGYNGSTWDTIGGDVNGIIASGDISEVEIEKIGSSLYLHYLIDNTLHVKHLEGTSWITDLTWSKDNIINIDFARSSSDLYFISGSTNSVYRGGVYKVTSASTAEEIISNATDDWFQFPLSLTIDSEDNLVAASMYYDEATTSFYPYLNVYDGSEWKTVSADFSDGMEPACVSAIGTDIIYIYGDAASENAIGDPAIIRSVKFSK